MAAIKQFVSFFFAALVAVFAAACADDSGGSSVPDVPALPQIVTFAATDYVVAPSETITVHWDVVGATTVRLFHPTASVEDPGVEIVEPTGYRELQVGHTVAIGLRAENDDGASVATLTIRVGEDVPRSVIDESPEDTGWEEIPPDPNASSDDDPDPTPTAPASPEPTPPVPAGCYRARQAVAEIEIHHAPYYWDALAWGLRVHTGGLERDAAHLSRDSGTVWNCSSGNWDERYPEWAPTQICVALQYGALELEWSESLVDIADYRDVPGTVTFAVTVQSEDGRDAWSFGAFTLQKKTQFGKYLSPDWCPNE